MLDETVDGVEGIGEIDGSNGEVWRLVLIVG